jgi:Spy/CpxP family protein refolding chaperone
MKRTLILILTFLVTAGAFANPARREGEGRRRASLAPRAVADFLDLTEAQKSQVASLRQSQKAAIQPLREKLRANRAEVRDALEAGNADKAGELMLASYALRQQIRTAHESFKSSFEALLTAPQKAKWSVFQEIRELRREHRRRRG